MTRVLFRIKDLMYIMIRVSLIIEEMKKNVEKRDGTEERQP